MGYKKNGQGRGDYFRCSFSCSRVRDNFSSRFSFIFNNLMYERNSLFSSTSLAQIHPVIMDVGWGIYLEVKENSKILSFLSFYYFQFIFSYFFQNLNISVLLLNLFIYYIISFMQTYIYLWYHSFESYFTSLHLILIIIAINIFSH